MSQTEIIRERISADTDKELFYLIDLFKDGGMPGQDCHMKDLFAVAKTRPESFRNHSKVLGLSFGGSNTKVILGHTEDGEIYADYLMAQPNPDEHIHLFDYLDMICKTPVIDDYLRNTPQLEIGVSIPMFIIDRCPYSVTKIPTIEGFIARDMSQIGPEFDFEKNFAEYMASRGYTNPYHLYYQSDGIVAHIGAVSVADVGPNDKPMLCVCGTGMATSDETMYYIPAYLTTCIPDDEELWPAADTENRQLNYAIAGKGLFGLMRHACELRVRLGGSALEGKQFAGAFATAKDSRKVGELAQKAAGVPYDEGIIAGLRDIAGEDGLAEMEEIALIIMKRCWESLSNTIISTCISTGPLENGGKYVVFLEGSVARNALVKPMILKDIEEKKAKYEFAAADGAHIDLDYVFDPDLRKVRTADPALEPLLKSIDVTLIGAMTMVMADEIAQDTKG